MSVNLGTLGFVSDNSGLATRFLQASSQITWPLARYANYQDLVSLGRDLTAIVTDYHHNGTTAVELQKQLAERGMHLPMLILCDDKLPPHEVLAVCRSGCYQIIPTTIGGEELFQTLQGLRAVATVYSQCESERRRFRTLFHSLSQDERSVAKLIIEGKPNKVIAARFDVSLRTIESRRARIFAKTNSESVCELAKAMAILEGKMFSLEKVIDPLPTEVKATVLQLLTNHHEQIEA